MKLTRKEYTTQEEKKKDFWLGVGIWFGLNLLIFAINTALSFVINNPNLPSGLSSTLNLILLAYPYLVNIGLIIYFALTRSQVALGMLAAIGAILVIVVCLGIIFTVACFVLLGTSNGSF